MPPLRSIVLVYTLFTLLYGAVVVAIVYWGWKLIPYCWIVVGVLLLVYVLIVAWWFVWPVARLGAQARLLFMGKPYKMQRALRKDELGDLTHFFNRITRSIEEVIGAVEQGQRLGTEVEVGKEIQAHVLPTSVSAVPYLDIVVRTRPAAEMGGDSFDFISFEEETFFYVGDATGHGIPAGLIMMMVNILMHALCTKGADIRDILVEMNRVLHPKMLKTRFMTVTLLHWDHVQRQLSFAGAGHERLFLYRSATGAVETVLSGGIALGMIGDTSAITKKQEVAFAEGDLLLMYSDGITEATDEKGALYGEERLQQEFAKAASKYKDADRVFEAVSRDYGEFVAGVPQKDDVTLMIIARIPNAEGSQHISLAGVEGSSTQDFWV